METRIGGLDGAARAGAGRRARPAGERGFRLPDAEAPAAPAIETVAEPAVRAPLLATPREAEARRHGDAVLAALADLQAAMLTEAGGQPALERLAALAGAAPEAGCPALDSVLIEIRVRAAIERARRGVT